MSVDMRKVRYIDIIIKRDYIIIQMCVCVCNINVCIYIYIYIYIYDKNIYIYIYIYAYIDSILASWVKCSPMAREIGIQSKI